MNNLIGANTWIWVSPPTDDGLAELIPKIASLGFGVVELPIENPGDWSPEPVAELLEAHGLGATTCLVMPPGRDLGATDADTRETTQAYLRHCVDVTARIDATTLCGPCYTSVGRTWRLDADDRAALVTELIAALRPVADYAGMHGVRIALEPLNRFETSVVNTVDQALEIVSGVDSPALGIAYDTFHANIEEKDMAGALRAGGDRLVHVQVCGNDRGAPGNDHIAWPAILDAIGDVRYGGPLCIESFTAENVTIATAASIWRSFEGSQDAIAIDGLAFLSNLLDQRGRDEDGDGHNADHQRHDRRRDGRGARP